MAVDDDIVSLLSEFGKNLVSDLNKSLRKEGVTFGGQDSKLAAQLNFKVVKSDNKISFVFSAPDYAYFVDKGRKPGNVSKKGQKSISEWAKRKGIVGQFAQDSLNARLKKQAQNKSNRKKKQLKKYSFDKSLKALTFLVSRKIKNKGYEGTGFYSKVVTDEYMNEIKDKIAKLIKTDVEIIINKNGLN